MKLAPATGMPASQKLQHVWIRKAKHMAGGAYDIL